MADRAALLGRVSAAPEILEPGLHVFLDAAEGLEGRIDLVARDRQGGAVVIGVAGDDDLTALAHLLAQRSWLTPRVRDWARLAPQLGLVPERGVRAILCATRFDPRSDALAQSLGGEAVTLKVLALEPLIRAERVEVAAAAPPSVGASAEPTDATSAPPSETPATEPPRAESPAAPAPPAEPDRAWEPEAREIEAPPKARPEATTEARTGHEPGAQRAIPAGQPLQSRFRSGLRGPGSGQPSRESSARPRSAPRGVG